MNSLVQDRVRQYLQTRLQYDPFSCGAILFNMRHAAQVAGFELDHRFAHAGLSAGPDARVASGIVDRALGGGGGGVVSDPIMKSTLDRWVQTTPGMGM